MAITQEQYDDINVGDSLTVAWKPESSDNWEILSGVVGNGYTGKFIKWMNISPKYSGSYVTILEHVKPKPAWHDAKVIKTKIGGTHYLRNPYDGRFTNPTGKSYPVSDFADNAVEIVVA